MGRIRVLDDPTINRIAAGEVVERPASVVKELAENSLDAGARSIEIRVVAGGRRLVRVADDGCGMDRDDALLALERHATSKLVRVEDLQAIATLGFRGEALPSIAAVSRFTLRTAAEAGRGTEVEVRDGKILAVREVGVPRGTTVEVAGLFRSIPVRRKFLRAEATELAHVVRFVSRFALVHPAVRLRLEHGERILIDAPPADSLEQRVGRIYGHELAGRLLPFSLERGDVRVHGMAGRPVDGSARRDGQHLFVNGRVVQDRVLAHALRQAYGNTMPSDRHPVAFVFVDAAPAEVDVNVHPQKTEVRFRRSQEVHDAVRDAVASALAARRAVPALTELRPAGRLAESLGGVAEATRTYLERARTRPETIPPPPAAHSGVGTRDGGTPAAGPAQNERPVLRALAQFQESYIVAEDGEGLVLVDQHAAHERVLFERYLAQAEQDRVELQRLMFPVTVELAPDERVLVESEVGELRRLGFVVEAFGGDAVRIDAVPAIAGDRDPAVFLRELVGEAARTPSARAGVGDLRRRLVTSAACQAAIKIHHRLNLPGMQALLDDLSEVDNPTTCPHGRPALFRIRMDEIERGFRRR